MPKRFYYKKKDNSAYFSLKTPDLDRNDDYERITEEEWIIHLATIEGRDNYE